MRSEASPEERRDTGNEGDPDFSFLQILPGNVLLDRIRSDYLPRYDYLLKEFVQKSPDEIQEWEFLQKMEKGIRINIREKFENLITNVLMAIFSTGTLMWQGGNGKIFFIKINMPSGITHRLFSLLKEESFGRDERKHLRDYLQNPDSYEYFRNITCDCQEHPTMDTGEDHYLLHLNITPGTSVFKKFSTIVEKHHYSNKLYFPDDYLSFFTKTIGEIVISDPSMLCRTDFYNFMDSFAFSLNLNENYYRDDEWLICKNLDSVSKKFIVNVLITDFLHNTQFFNELDLNSISGNEFISENIRTIKKVSNAILYYIWKTIYWVFINEGRFYKCSDTGRIAEFMDKLIPLSRFVVINWNGNGKEIYLPGNGTDWKREEFSSNRTRENEIRETTEMRNKLLRDYPDASEYLMRLTEKVWSGQ